MIFKVEKVDLEPAATDRRWFDSACPLGRLHSTTVGEYWVAQEVMFAADTLTPLAPVVRPYLRRQLRRQGYVITRGNPPADVSVTVKAH